MTELTLNSLEQSVLIILALLNYYTMLNSWAVLFIDNWKLLLLLPDQLSLVLSFVQVFLDHWMCYFQSVCADQANQQGLANVAFPLKWSRKAIPLIKANLKRDLKSSSVDKGLLLFFYQKQILCSSGLSATSQQYFSLTNNQNKPPSTSQSTVLFSHNKSAPATSHRPTKQGESSSSFLQLKLKDFFRILIL